QAHAAREGLAEALLLGREDAVDVVAVPLQLRVTRLHLLDHDVGETREIRRLETDPSGLLHCAADDAAHAVAAPLAGGRAALGREERYPATVVGEDAMRL